MSDAPLSTVRQYCREFAYVAAIWLEAGSRASGVIMIIATGTCDIGSAHIGALIAFLAIGDLLVAAGMKIFHIRPCPVNARLVFGATSLVGVTDKCIAPLRCTFSSIFVPCILANNGTTKAVKHPDNP